MSRRYSVPCSRDIKCCRNDGHEGPHLYPDHSPVGAHEHIARDPAPPARCMACDGLENDPYHGPEPCVLCPHASPHHAFRDPAPPAPDRDMHIGRLAAFCSDCGHEITHHTDCAAGDGLIRIADAYEADAG